MNLHISIKIRLLTRFVVRQRELNAPTTYQHSQSTAETPASLCGTGIDYQQTVTDVADLMISRIQGLNLCVGCVEPLSCLLTIAFGNPVTGFPALTSLLICCQKRRIERHKPRIQPTITLQRSIWHRNKYFHECSLFTLSACPSKTAPQQEFQEILFNRRNSNRCLKESESSLNYCGETMDKLCLLGERSLAANKI